MLRPRPRHHRSRDRRVGGTGRRSRRPSAARPPRPRRPGGTPCTRPVAGTEGETPGAKSPPWRLSPNMWDPRDTGEVDRIESPPGVAVAPRRGRRLAAVLACGPGPSSATPMPPPSGTCATDLGADPRHRPDDLGPPQAPGDHHPPLEHPPHQPNHAPPLHPRNHGSPHARRHPQAHPRRRLRARPEPGRRPAPGAATGCRRRWASSSSGRTPWTSSGPRPASSSRWTISGRMAAAGPSNRTGCATPGCRSAATGLCGSPGGAFVTIPRASSRRCAPS